MESEKVIEKYLVEQVESLGGLCRKYNSGIRGVPDRICFFPKGVLKWVELKSEGERPTDAQVREHQRMIQRGHHVWVIDLKQTVDLLIEEVKYELFRNI